MEEKGRGKGASPPEVEAEASQIWEQSGSVALEKTGGRKTKRDTLKQKKRAKTAEVKSGHSDELETDNVSNKQKEDEAGSVGSQESSCKIAKKERIISDNASALLPKLLNKPPYLSLASPNRIVGNFGHASVIFKRPIIQGAYFIQLTVKQDAKKDKPTTYPSAVRVGVCLHNFDSAYPLGYGESIGYKSADGSIVRQNEREGKAEPYSVGDVIGVCLRVRPLRKHRQEKEVDEGSTVEFYKNGKLVSAFEKLKQQFYCFGVSVYNYAQVEVSSQQESVHRVEGAEHYYTSLDQKVPYHDLLANNLFKP